MYFNKLLDSKDYEISSYVKKYIFDNSIYPIKLHVGCDSQNISNHTNYATTVLFHIGNTGCHFLYHKERLPKIQDMWTKLWGETTRSVDVAIYLKDRGIIVDSIDLDFNSDTFGMFDPNVQHEQIEVLPVLTCGSLSCACEMAEVASFAESSCHVR